MPNLAPLEINTLPDNYFAVRANVNVLDLVSRFIIEEGTTSPFFLMSEEEVKEHLRGLEDDSTRAIIVGRQVPKHNPVIDAIGTYSTTHDFAIYQPVGRKRALHGEVDTLVVRKRLYNRGLGTTVLTACIKDLISNEGVSEVYAMYGQKDPAMEAIMRKRSVGMQTIGRVHDPTRKPVPGGVLVVSRYIAS